MENEIIDVQEEHVSTAQLVKGSNPSQADGQMALFPGNETENFRDRWHHIQGSFVDEPKQAVEKADELVASVIKRLAEVFAAEREKLESDWGKEQDISTENLRQALRRYRSFFDRLLSV